MGKVSISQEKERIRVSLVKPYLAVRKKGLVTPRRGHDQKVRPSILDRGISLPAGQERLQAGPCERRGRRKWGEARFDDGPAKKDSNR